MLQRISEIPKRSDKPEHVTRYPDEKAFLRGHFFDNVDFSDLRLLRTPFLSANYRLYLDWLEPREEVVFDRAIAYLCSLTASNADMNRFSIKFLVRYFTGESFLNNFKKVLQMGLDLDIPLAVLFRNMDESSLHGQQAPDIALPDLHNTLVHLRQIKSEYVLIFFWSPECESCQSALRQLPQLRSVFSPADFQIYAVALTDDEYLWRDMLMQQQADWINTIEYEGQNSPVAITYGIKSIPAFILMDRTGQIVAANSSLVAMRGLLDVLLSIDH